MIDTFLIRKTLNMINLDQMQTFAAEKSEN